VEAIVNQNYDDLRALYRDARRDEEPLRSDKRAVRVALVGAGTAAATFHTAAAAGKLLALVPGVGKALTVGQVVLYASIGAAVGGGLAVVGAKVSSQGPAARSSAPAARVEPAVHARAPVPAPVVLHEGIAATQRNLVPASAGTSAPQTVRAAIQASSENPPQAAARAAATAPSAEPERLTAAPAANAQPPSLVDESRALGAVQAALNTSDATGAIRLLDAQDRQFATGSLVQERAAARVLALCMAGRTVDAHAARDQFLVAYPGSPLARRINAACEK
jgi:hypothetical protein